MSAHNDAPSSGSTAERISYAAQLEPEQIRWLKTQADRHDRTVDQVLRAILATVVAPPSETDPSSEATADRVGASGDGTVLSTLRAAEEKLEGLRPVDTDDEAPSPEGAEDDPPASETEDSEGADASTDHSAPPSSMFDLAEDL